MWLSHVCTEDVQVGGPSVWAIAGGVRGAERPDAHVWSVFDGGWWRKRPSMYERGGKRLSVGRNVHDLVSDELAVQGHTSGVHEHMHAEDVVQATHRSADECAADLRCAVGRLQRHAHVRRLS